MKVYLLAYAMLKESFPQNPLAYELAENSTVEQLFQQLARDFPHAQGMLKCTRLAHADDYLDPQTQLKAEAEYCLIPPVSGG